MYVQCRGCLRWLWSWVKCGSADVMVSVFKTRSSVLSDCFYFISFWLVFLFFSLHGTVVSALRALLHRPRLLWVAYCTHRLCSLNCWVNEVEWRVGLWLGLGLWCQIHRMSALHRLLLIVGVMFCGTKCTYSANLSALVCPKWRDISLWARLTHTQSLACDWSISKVHRIRVGIRRVNGWQWIDSSCSEISQ